MPKEAFGIDYPFLPKSAILSFEEIVRVAGIFIELGAEKIRLTGGEPLLRKDLPKLVGMLSMRAKSTDLSLTTNGTLLARFAEDLKANGLRRVNVSLDSLETKTFEEMSGASHSPETVISGIEKALSVGLKAKVNMVVKKGVNDHEIIPMARRFKSLDVPLRFIEFMDVGTTNRWNLEQVVPKSSILEMLSSEFEFDPIKADYSGEVAARYMYRDNGSEFGIISSISEPFCANCNRARLSADGKLFTCLFATRGHDIKSVLRDDTEHDALAERIRNIWIQRNDRYSDQRNDPGNDKSKRIEMSYIGG